MNTLSWVYGPSRPLIGHFPSAGSRELMQEQRSAAAGYSWSVYTIPKISWCLPEVVFGHARAVEYFDHRIRERATIDKLCRDLGAHKQYFPA